MTNETTSFNTLKAAIAQPRDRISRIENIVANGTPDVNYCIGGREGWVEIKTPKKVPVRETTPLFASLNHPLSQEQANWFKEQWIAGGLGFIYVDTPTRRYLLPGSCADDVNEATPSQFMQMAVWSATVPTAQERWKELREVLRGR